MSQRTSQPYIAIALWVALGLLFGGPSCQSDAKSDDKSNGDVGRDPPISTDIDIPPIPDQWCPDPPALVVPSEAALVVGDGTPQSCTEDALQTAVATINAQSGGDIVFDCGDAHTIVLNEALYLSAGKGNPVLIDGGNTIVLSGGNATRILDLDNHSELIVQRIALEDGFVAAAEPEKTNTPSNSGAAIRHPWYGTLLAIDVAFRNNRCASREGEIGGGAIYAGGLRSAIFSGCTFVNNTASNGGGILNRGSTLTVVNSVFAGNGALSTGKGQFGNGGGLYIDGMNYDDPGDFYMCGTRFIENTAMTHGSGVFAYFYEGSSATIENCEFDANRFGDPASGSGALYHEAAPLVLRNTAFHGQTTGAHAGAIFLGQKSQAQVDNCTFSGNAVTTNGGAIFNGAAEMHLRHCTFTGNKADYGPAIFKGQSAVMSLHNCIFANNLTDNAYSATSCHESLESRGGNLQWPPTKSSGADDMPCATDILFADPGLQPMADHGGFAPLAAVPQDSPAVGLGTQCLSRDARGVQRPEHCTAGAFEGSDL
ncbi:MAG: right-handed parallel beta-helix repeat-containing protein [Proteobacteria bacterium]|nr:right-handed parallel beta-helix repeat-containing protein [Pseudomonadota bacterium]